MTARFGRVPAWLFDMAPQPLDVSVYTALTTFANGDDFAWPGIDTIAKMVSRSPTQVRLSLNSLVTMGLLVVEQRPGRTNTYTLPRDHPPSQAVDNPVATTPTADRTPSAHRRGPLRPTEGEQENLTEDTHLTTFDGAGAVDNSQPRQQAIWQMLTDTFGEPVAKRDRGVYSAIIKRAGELGWGVVEMLDALQTWAVQETNAKWRRQPGMFLRAMPQLLAPMSKLDHGDVKRQVEDEELKRRLEER